MQIVVRHRQFVVNFRESARIDG